MQSLNQMNILYSINWCGINVTNLEVKVGIIGIDGQSFNLSRNLFSIFNTKNMCIYTCVCMCVYKRYQSKSLIQSCRITDMWIVITQYKQKNSNYLCSLSSFMVTNSKCWIKILLEIFPACRIKPHH